MVVIVPMAGRGSRFSNAGFETPKPLINVAGKPMILWALQTLRDVSFTRIVFVALQEHEEQYGIRKLLKNYNGWSAEFVLLDKVTEGQLCTVLAAENFFEPADEILVAASDSYVKSPIGEDIRSKNAACAGLISVISLQGSQWSFAKTDDTGKVVEVAEKRRISDHCSTGLYHFSKAEHLVDHGNKMIAANLRERNEFYIIPVYQQMINAGLLVGISKAEEMWDMGTPEAKQSFEKYISRSHE